MSLLKIIYLLRISYMHIVYFDDIYPTFPLHLFPDPPPLSHFYVLFNKKEAVFISDYLCVHMHTCMLSLRHSRGQWAWMRTLEPAAFLSSWLLWQESGFSGQEAQVLKNLYRCQEEADFY